MNATAQAAPARELPTYFIYRGETFLGAFAGTRQQADDYAFEQWGIGCSVLRYREEGSLP